MNSEGMDPWPIEKRPIQKFTAPFSGILRLPHCFDGVHGSAELSFTEGDDLNGLVYDYYAAEATPENRKGRNYVGDEIHPKRHEYLGPRPYVAGYSMDRSTRSAVIEWFDQYLGVRWKLSK